MRPAWFAKLFPPRLKATLPHARYQHIAAAPSYRAPDVRELQREPACEEPDALPPEERRLLEIIITHPEDDASRLTLAEYYDRLRDPRGAFIRAQLADATTTPPDCILALTHETFAPWSGRDFVWRRGLVAGLSLSGRAFLSRGGTILNLAPIEEIRLVSIQPFLQELAACPHLLRLKRLDLRDNRLGSELLEVVQSPLAKNITHWNLTGNRLTLQEREILVGFGRQVELPEGDLVD